MGKVISRLNKQYYRFNAENRALREISREKPIPAPRHPSSEKAMEMMLKETKHIKEEAMMKDPTLDDYLKKVYVVSHDSVNEKKAKPLEKSLLPHSRALLEETELGYIEPQVIPRGKVTLLQVMKFLADHQGDAHVFNASRISNDYSLSKEHVDNLLEYYGSFKVHIKEERIQIEESVKDKLLKHFSENKKSTALPDKVDVQQKPET